jgi:hypothetical protein
MTMTLTLTLTMALLCMYVCAVNALLGRLGKGGEIHRSFGV